MYKVLAIAVLCCLALQAAGDDDRCSAQSIMQLCLPNYHQYLHRREPVNSISALNVATNSTGFLAHCPRFIEVGRCIRTKFQENGCTVPTDAANVNVVRFRAAREAVNLVCGEKAADFVAARACLSSAAVRQALQACANAANHEEPARRKRHTCIDYNTEVDCAGRAVSSACPSIAADFHAFTGRLLKMTPHTALCAVPAVLSN